MNWFGRAMRGHEFTAHEDQDLLRVDANVHAFEN